MQSDPIVIVGCARTPLGAFQGELKNFTAPELGAAAIRAAVERAKLRPDDLQEVLMGCVLPAGQGQAPARQAALGASLPLATGCTTVNKMCGSGMKAAMLAHDILAAGSADVIVAGGMESMTNAPYLLPKARAGLRMGHAQVIDHMFYDGLEDAYDRGRLMGAFAEECAQKYAFTREAQDQFAVASLTRAQKANQEGWFAWEITPIAINVQKVMSFRPQSRTPWVGACSPTGVVVTSCPGRRYAATSTTGINFRSALFLPRMRVLDRLRRAFRSDRKQTPQLQPIHDNRSVRLIVRIITSATIAPPSVASTLLAEAGAVRLAITVIAWLPCVMIVRRIAMSSSAGERLRQPGIRITLHAGAVRPQPWLSDAETIAIPRFPASARIASPSRAAWAMPRGQPSEISIPSMRTGPLVSLNGMRRMLPGIESSNIAGTGPPSASIAASFQSGDVIRMRFGSTPMRSGCWSPSLSSTPGRRTVPSPALAGLRRAPLTAPSNVLWSVTYAASKPELECHSRFLSASNPARPS